MDFFVYGLGYTHELEHALAASFAIAFFSKGCLKKINHEIGVTCVRGRYVCKCV